MDNNQLTKITDLFTLSNQTIKYQAQLFPKILLSHSPIEISINIINDQTVIIAMTPKKSLPVLKLFIYPTIGMLLYSAYCYYQQQYNHYFPKLHAPIKYCRDLITRSNEAKTLGEVAFNYYAMSKHINKFFIDISTKNSIMHDRKIHKLNKENLWMTEYQIRKQFSFNYFNWEDNSKEGIFLFGIWKNLRERNNLKFKDTQTCLNSVKQMADQRQQICRKFATHNQQFQHFDYIHVYNQCLKLTCESESKLRRYQDMVEKMLQYC